MIRQANPRPNDKVLDALKRVIDSGMYVKGPESRELEKNFKSISGCEYNYTVNSGTSALNLLLTALDYPIGSEVIVPVNTFLATANAVELTHYTSVFVDVDESMNIDPTKIEAAITDKTKAIIVVHLYGTPADMDPIMAIAKKHGLDVIEDACQAHSATYKGKTIGTIGRVAAYSLFPTKNFTVLGDGGMVSTNDKELGAKIAKMRNAGRDSLPDDADEFGFNFRLSETSAAIGNALISDFHGQTERRREIAERYNQGLNGVGDLILPSVLPNTEPVWHQYTIRTSKRDELREYLRSKDIQSSIKYSLPLHLVKAFQKKYGIPEGTYPVGEKICKTLLCLPMHPFLSDDEVDTVISEIQNFYS